MNKNNKNSTSSDTTLSPKDWNSYIGQTQAKKRLEVLIRAARERNQPPEHILLYGPHGLGKTTLARLIGEKVGSGVKTLSAPAIERPGDIVSVISSLKELDILFIDEIHRLNKTAEEILYPIMEEGEISLVVGKGPGARNVVIKLPAITIVGATTHVGNVSSPLRSRFQGGVLSLEYYTEEEIGEILKNSAKNLGIEIDKDALLGITKRSRQTPRTANHIIKRARDLAQINQTIITKEIMEKTFQLLQLDETGLSKNDVKLLEILRNSFNGGPVGLQNLSIAMSEPESTIEEVYEPFLIRLGYIERSSSGRKITKAGIKYLDSC